MSLTTCPDCSREVSDEAPACPHCGRPMKAQTVELTGKEWKAGQLLGCGLMVLGMVGCITSCSGEHVSTWGIIAFFAGLVVLIVAQIGGWWHHG